MIYKIKNGDKLSAQSIDTNFIEVRLNNIFTKKQANFEQIPFDSISYQIGSKLTLKNGKIIIGKGIKYVKIWGQAMISNTSTAQKLTLHIQKNSVQTVTEGISYSTSAYSQINTIPKISPVKEGDYFEIQIHSNSGDTFPANTNNFLIVEAIQ